MTQNLRSMHDFADIARDMGVQSEEAVIRGLQSAGYRLEGMIPDAIATASPRPPQDTGELTRSHYTIETKTGALVGVDAPQAVWMEYGTRPHRPPMQPLADWAYRKGIVDAELEMAEIWTAEDVAELSEVEQEALWIVKHIVAAIAINGIEPRHFMRSAVDKLIRDDIIGKEIKAELAKMR